MKKINNLIVADRDRRVRAFLSREMVQAGYRVIQARDGFELISLLDAKKQTDLLILDPHFPDAEPLPILLEVTEKFPLLPIIVHSYRFDQQFQLSVSNPLYYIEKSGNSIELLISRTGEILSGEAEKRLQRISVRR